MQSQRQVQELILADQNPVLYKMDRMYFNSLDYVKKTSIISIVLQWTKTAYIVAITSWYFSSHTIKNNDFFPALIVAMTMSFVLGIIHIILITYTKNLSKNLEIAKQLHHLVEQPYSPTIRYNVFEDWISNVYNYKQPQNYVPNTDEQKLTAELIRHYYFVTNKDLNIINKFADLSLFGIAIWLAVQLGTNQVDTTLKIYAVIYLIFEMLIHWRLILVLLFMALLPLICIILCLGSCFCKPKRKQDFIKKLQPIDYRDSIQLQHGVQCLICFTNFYPNQKICILQCPAKHAFHQLCIKAWFQVGSTCPVCRHDFQQND